MKSSRNSLLLLLLLLSASPAWASSETLDGASLSLYWGIPFAGILLSIALMPLISPLFWHHHYGKVAAGWALAFLVPFAFIHGFGAALHGLVHAAVGEYIPFILLLTALFTCAGGIHISGTLRGRPILNTGLLALGTSIASFMGTTGASMLLIRPLIRANDNRRHQAHVIVFFIFLVSNIGGVLTPLGHTKPKTIHLFTNLMNGFEEMAIYWFAILLFYARIKRQLGLTASAVRAAAERVPMSAVLRRHPAARYAAFLMLLAVCNNLVMLAAPTFPGRATFSSAAMFVAAALALLGDSAVMTALGTPARRTLCAAALLLFAYTGTAALLITQEMHAADAARIAQIEDARARGETVVHFPRIERTNRALRHVYYEDWDNNVTKEGAMEYFGLTDVIVDEK